jgi:hypothetical protein
MENLTTMTTGIPEAPSGQPVPSKEGPIGVELHEKKKGPGRPRKDEPRPITPEPPPKKRKDPDDIKDHYSAIKRCKEEQQKHIDAYRAEHPEAECCDAIDPFEQKRKPGAPIAKNAFYAPLVGITAAAGALGDVKKDEMPTEQDYAQCAEEWARASTHLGLTERAAALFSAVSETVRVTGFTLAKSVRNMVRGHNGDPNRPLTKVEGTHEAKPLREVKP